MSLTSKGDFIILAETTQQVAKRKKNSAGTPAAGKLWLLPMVGRKTANSRL